MATINVLPDKQFRVWSFANLYFGTGDPGEKWKPNIDDMVINWSEGIYRVSSVDQDGIPTLELKMRFNQQSIMNLESTSLITALSQYQPTAATPIYVDDSVTPAVVTVDSRYRLYGSEAAKMIFYLGTDIGQTGTIISEVRDTSGNLSGNEITLEQMGSPTAKRPLTFVTSRLLKGGEVITGVAYNATGGQVATQPFLVRKSAAVRPADLAGIFITDVTLDTPLLSPTDKFLILNQQGVPFNTTLLTARIHYSDGSSKTANIDGTRVVISGLKNFDSSAVGLPVNIILHYYPDASEPFVNGAGGSKNHISRPYRLANVVKDTSFKLRVYLVPTFKSVVDGYDFRWYLTTLEGDVNVDVTQYVNAFRADGQPLNKVDYGNLQELTLSLDMEKVAPGVYDGHIHTQKLDVTLNIPGTADAPAWLIDYLGDGTVIYGKNGVAQVSNAGAGVIEIYGDAKTQQEFIDGHYFTLNPLFDGSVQQTATAPTHFRLSYGGITTPNIPVSSWKATLPKQAGSTAFVDKGTVDIVWIHSTAAGDRVIGHSPMLVRTTL